MPRLIGVVHLPPLPGSPRYEGSLGAVCAAAVHDAIALQSAGFDAIMVENFGDVPFVPGEVPPITVAAMTRCALAIRRTAPELRLGINVLRNDARAALAIAAACDASLIRVNVHVGVRISDQGTLEGRAHETLRTRRELGLENVAIFADVAVKHSAAPAPRRIDDEARDAVSRGLADAILVTGRATGDAAEDGDIDTVLAAVDAPVYIASGARKDQLEALLRQRQQGRVHGVIVGSALRRSGKAGDSVDADLAKSFAYAMRAALAKAR